MCVACNVADSCVNVLLLLVAAAVIYIDSFVDSAFIIVILYTNLKADMIAHIAFVRVAFYSGRVCNIITFGQEHIYQRREKKKSYKSESSNQDVVIDRVDRSLYIHYLWRTRNTLVFTHFKFSFSTSGGNIMVS